MKNIQKIVVKKKNVVGMIFHELRDLGQNDILIKTLMSSISHATELGVIRGTTPTFRKKWNDEYRLYTKGKPTKKYPSSLGYENVGEVISVGKEVREYKKGDIVWTDSSHQEMVVVDVEKDQICKLPSKKDLKKGVFLALTRVALAGIHDADIRIGDRVAVFGQGTIGLLTLQLAQRASQTSCFGVEPIRIRQNMGRSFGGIILDPNKQDAAFEIHRLTGGFGVDVAIETSGCSEALHEALRSCRIGGRVVTVGTYRQGAKGLYLAEEWHRNRIEMISSMTVNSCSSRSYPRWSLERLNSTALQLLLDKKVKVEELVTHVFPFKQAVKAYQLLMSHPERTIKIVLSYE